jgi:hypothetical protein
MKRIALGFACLLVASVAQAAQITIYSAPGQYQNGGVNPCVFSGNGENGCNQTNFAFPDWVTSTQQFATNPLVNVYDTPTEIGQFAAQVGRDFFLGLDVNQAGQIQTMTEMTITFKDINGNVLGTGYQFSPTPVQIPFTTQGEGYTDYVMSAGCLGTVAGGAGVAATCSQYTPFTAPTGTRSISFTFGMGTFNDGAERLFLISAGPTPTPFNVDPTAVPEPGSMVLLGTGLFALAGKARQRLRRRQAMEKA